MWNVKSNSNSEFKVSLQVPTIELSMFFSFFHFVCVYAQRRICEAMKEGGGLSIIFIFILLLIIQPLALAFNFLCVFSLFFSFCLLQNNNNFKSQSRGVGCEVKLEKSLENLSKNQTLKPIDLIDVWKPICWKILFGPSSEWMLFHLGFNVANYLLRTQYIVKGIDLVQKTLTT